MEYQGLEACIAMTTQPESEQERAQPTGFLQFFKNLKIGTKLTFVFGILVLFILVSAGVSYLGSRQATTKIELTSNVRAPLAIRAARAQTNLLQMQADVRGYLALGDEKYRDSYNQSNQEFITALDELDDLLTQNPDSEMLQRLQEIRTAYAHWSQWPEQLFELRNDKVDREPAYRLLATDGMRFAGRVLININSIIEEQGQREATKENLALLQDMAVFQGNFSALVSALRNYVTTRNRIFMQYEYQANLTANQNTWETLNNKYSHLTPNQRALCDQIAENRETFLTYPEQLFDIVEGDRYREDLYLFRTEAIPQADKMQELLSQMVQQQQISLQAELDQGQQSLTTANQIIRIGGLVTLASGLVLSYVTIGSIANPVRRLTGVAEQIYGGDLAAQARVESRDEIGVLAETFNSMTSRLRQTLLQVRKEKQRADNLLEVVIPIGVELASEEDFNRLLEKMLLEAKTFCHADAGTLYLRTEDDKLRPVIIRNDSRGIALGGTTGQAIPFEPLDLYDPATGEPNHLEVATHVALTGTSVNIPDAVQEQAFDFEQRDPNGGIAEYHITSVLTIPLKNSANEVKGVMQLLNSQDPETGQVMPFDQNLQQQMESFSLLAVAALEAYIREQSLRQEIQQLRIEIDQVKRQEQVSEIVETDFFQDLRAKARRMRRRAKPTDKSDQKDQ
jgi:CHASE3 domain sensor protein/HAMP domain-containing protein